MENSYFTNENLDFDRHSKKLKVIKVLLYSYINIETFLSFVIVQNLSVQNLPYDA